MTIDIFEAIKEELSYQDKMSAAGTSHVRENLTEGECILAIDKLVGDAKVIWYSGNPPHSEVRNLARKIASLCVRMCMDENGMPKRGE